MTDSAVCHEMIRDDQGVEGGGQCVCVHYHVRLRAVLLCPCIRVIVYPHHHVSESSCYDSCIRVIMYQ